MMDIVERLKDLYGAPGHCVTCDAMREAADEIERLRAAIKRVAERCDYYTNLPADRLARIEVDAVTRMMASLLRADMNPRDPLAPMPEAEDLLAGLPEGPKARSSSNPPPPPPLPTPKA